MFFSMKKNRFIFAGLVLALLVICTGFTSDAQEENNTLQNDENGIIQNDSMEVSNTKMNSLEEQGVLNKTSESEQIVVQRNDALQQNDVMQKNSNEQNSSVATGDNSQQKQKATTNKNVGFYYNPEAYLVPDQKTALLTVSTNDTTNIQRVFFRVWTGDGSDMRGFDSYLQSDGRWMSFVPVEMYCKSGTYNCLATVVFRDGHEENVGFAYFNVDPVSIGSMSMQNINERAGTFDIVLSDVYCPSGVSFIDIVAFTRQDLSDAHLYYAYNQGNGTFVANCNVGYHNYNYGSYGLFGSVHSSNGLVASTSGGGTINMPQTQLSTFTADNQNYFLIAENTPYDSTCIWTNFYVWHDGLSDLHLYRGFRDGNRWLAIVPVSDYGKSGNYSFVTRGQMFFGPEIDYGATNFTVEPSSVRSLHVCYADNSAGFFDVMLGGVKGLGGVRGIRTVIFTQPDWSDAYSYGYIDCGNGDYLLRADVALHQYHYGLYEIAVIVTNGFGYDELAYANFYDLQRPVVTYEENPNYRQTQVTLGNTNLPYTRHIFGMNYFVWSAADGSDMRCYSTIIRSSADSFQYVMPMSDFNKTGTFYVRPQIVRDDWSSEWLDLQSFTIDKAQGQTEVLEVKKEGGLFATINQAINWAEYIGYDILNKIELLIHPGTYTEKIKLLNKHGISLIGTDRNSVIIEDYTTYPDCIVNVVGDVTFKNLTIRTTGGATYAVHSDGQSTPSWGGTVTFDNCSIIGGTRAIGYGASQNSSLQVKNCELYGSEGAIYAHNCPYSDTGNQRLGLESNVFKVCSGNVAIKFDDASNYFGTSNTVLNVYAVNNRYEGSEGKVLAGAYPERASFPTVDFRSRPWYYPIILHMFSSGNSNIPALNA